MSIQRYAPCKPLTCCAANCQQNARMNACRVPYDHPHVSSLIHAALDEDLAFRGDITGQCLVDSGAQLAGKIIAKEAGVICGVPLFEAVLRHLPGAVAVKSLVQDGDSIHAGDAVLEFIGAADAILIAERTALNLMQSLSGVATVTRRYVDLVAGTRCGIYDTRKTIPGQRVLQKHAVVCGGGFNHRIGLYDQVLIKENHIALMGATGPEAAADAVARCRQRMGDESVVQVEIEELDQLAGVIEAGADIVLCDNMGPDVLAQAVAIRDGMNAAPHDPGNGVRPVALEASGGITDKILPAIAASGVERVSIGALTHSVLVLDLSLLCNVN